MRIDIRLIIKLPAIIEKGINRKSTSDKLIFLSLENLLKLIFKLFKFFVIFYHSFKE